MGKAKRRVFVGLSGGVDSSVAALLLKRQGYEVVGVFIKVWQPDFIACSWERERLDAMRVAALLGIPFLTFDAEAVYKREVVDYLINEYAQGRTPNPDVMCNRAVKFGAFLDFAVSYGAQAVATGHYARITQSGDRRHLLRGADLEKDQSYFLWTLTEHQRARILFPLGAMKKTAVRATAARAGLPTAQKKDSQGVCFLGRIDMQEFLSHFVSTSAGAVLDGKGRRIGTHNGALFYTTGQRHGFSVTGGGARAHYVVGKDMKRNTITVAPRVPVVAARHIPLEGINQIMPFAQHRRCHAQFRYRATPVPVTLEEAGGSRTTVVVPPETLRPSAGQSCVLYDDMRVVGGGIIAW